MKTNTYSEHGLRHANPLRHGANRSSSATAVAALEFGRFRLLLRRHQLLADGAPAEHGSRAFDLLLVLLEADRLLVTKEELFSRVWPDIVVAEENLKVQVSVLCKALGADRDVIRTEFVRGYRFTGMLRSNAAADGCQRPTRARCGPAERCFRRTVGQSLRCSFSST